MKKGLLALILLALVAAIPACRQSDCNDKDRGCNPCSWLRCKKKCDEPKKEKVCKEKKKKCKKKCDPCGWLRCKKKCDKNDMMEEEEMAPRREEMMPRRMK